MNRQNIEMQQITDTHKL